MLVYDEEKLKLYQEANFARPYQQCVKTVMDTITDPFITFDEQGVCNYYYEYQQLEKSRVFKGAAGKQKLHEVVEKIRRHAKGKKYDCITGVSGGVDSTYLVMLAKKLGLNPLVVHFDNGWNSELAVKNIENIVSKLKLDLYTLVVDWEEFKDLQVSYFKSNVVDIEALTDHAIYGTLFTLARKHNIKFILSGSNVVTEGILPKYWIFNKTDSLNIRDIHKKYGTRPLKTYPLFSPQMKRYCFDILGIEIVTLLDYVDYVKSDVKKTIANELDWRDYGGKHYESLFTKFYQGFILPAKFGIDKRKAHLSTLICSGQISKTDAMEELERPIYAPDEVKTDKEFVLKKLGMSTSQFDEYLLAPRREHTDFRHEKGMWDDIPLIKLVRPVWRLVKTIKQS
jgi:N-acetyl sugar amidotransferase